MQSSPQQVVSRAHYSAGIIYLMDKERKFKTIRRYLIGTAVPLMHRVFLAIFWNEYIHSQRIESRKIMARQVGLAIV